jgi:hypothetical protein
MLQHIIQLYHDKIDILIVHHYEDIELIVKQLECNENEQMAHLEKKCFHECWQVLETMIFEQKLN